MSAEAAAKPASREHGIQGFTLLEVLVALVIVGLALGAIAGVFSNGLTAHETVSDAEAALAVADEQLALASAALRPGVSNGTYGGRFAWRATVAPYTDPSDRSPDAPAALPKLYSVAVSVAWQDGRHSRALSLSTLRLGATTP
jgi:general secretion pathway protein I